MNKKVTKTDNEIREIPTVVEETALDIFRPSKLMKQLKAEFYSQSRGRDLPAILDIEDVLKVIPDRRVRNWWENPSFCSWFMNGSEHVQKVDYLLARQLDNLEEIIEGDSELYSVKDKLAAGKQIMEYMKEFANNKDKSNGERELTAGDKMELAKAMMKQMKEDKEKADIDDIIPSVSLPT